MNEEYLWDKTGERDPEIQQLEELLGTLRYQPRPLVIPEELRTGRRRHYLPLLAIAATVVMALLAVSLWLRVQNRKATGPQEANLETMAPQPDRVKEGASPLAAGGGDSTPRIGGVHSKDDRSSMPPRLIAHNTRHSRRAPGLTLAANERREALAAKEQLLMALRVASEKLNLAQKKIQNPAPTNQIRNQHKIG